jgi:hypothetical protein
MLNMPTPFLSVDPDTSVQAITPAQQVQKQKSMRREAHAF